MSMKLKWNAPYGEIFGGYPEQPTAKYTQDGKLFDAQGNAILSAEEKLAYKQRLAAELAELESDLGTPPPAPAIPAPVATPAPVIPATAAAETAVEMTPQQKAAATRAAKKAANQKADPLGVLPPLED